ncbi:MAG: hypothetical protein ABIQ27_13050 [Flavobacterium sp.]|uniref:hypothetical protein n=1 Tax=Flavobacterium sp. TaxID=239 RepID=UPI00326478A7
MRPIIDTNNLFYSEETLVYTSRLMIVFRVFILVMGFGFSIYLLCSKDYLSALIVFLLSCFFTKEIISLMGEWNIVQLRINSRGIQIKNEPIIAWDKIENERVITVVINEKYDRSYEYHFAFYDTSQHKPMQFNAHKLNFSAQELLSSAQIHRGRFKK